MTDQLLIKMPAAELTPPCRWFKCDFETAFANWRSTGGTWESFCALSWQERAYRSQIECDHRRSRGEPDPEDTDVDLAFFLNALPPEPSAAEQWTAAREREIAAYQPQLLCRVMAEDPPPGVAAPCNALTPAMIRHELYSRTGITGWRVRLIDLTVLEILPPPAPEPKQ